jgi:hypothetical protein
MSSSAMARLGDTAVWFIWLVAAWLAPAEMRAPFVTIGLFMLVMNYYPGSWHQHGFRLGSVAVLPLLLIVVWWLYHPIFDAGWLADDPRLLRSVSEHGWLAHWYQPTVWRSLSGSFFTPWLTTSFAFDLGLFGLSSTGFYAHHLVSLGVALLLLHILLSRWMSFMCATLAVLLLTLSASTAGILQHLMTRHYIEGLCFYMIAVLLLYESPRASGTTVGAQRQGTGRRVWAALGAALFALLAMACKEVYLPLVAAVTLAPSGLGRNRRLRRMTPTWLALIFYLGWRLVMLGPGNMFTGYGSLANQSVSIAPWLEIAGGHSPGLAALIVLMVAIVVVLYRLRGWPSKTVVVFWLLISVLVSASILPVAGSPAPRYLWLPTIWCAVTVAALLEHLVRKRVVSMAVLAIMALMLSWSAGAVGYSPFWRVRPVLRAHKLVTSYVLTGGDSGTLLLTDLGSPLHFHSLAWLRRHQLGLGDGPRVCRDLCVCRLNGVTTALQQLGEELHPVPVPERPELCGDAMAPLVVAVDYLPDQSRLRWRFEGAAAGRWAIAGPSDVNHVSGHFREVPAAGEISFTLHEPYLFVVRYEHEDGWFSDSPWLRLDPSEPPAPVELRWQRPAATPPR